MRREFNLKSFDLFEYLKHQNAYNISLPFFLANNKDYKNAHVNFPFRTFVYGLGLTYSGKEDHVKIGSADYVIKPNCLITVGPGIVCSWADNYEAVNDTIYFTEELFVNFTSSAFLQSFPFFHHGGNHVLQLTPEQSANLGNAFKLLYELQHLEINVVSGIVYTLLGLAGSFHQSNTRNENIQGNSPKQKIVSGFRKDLAEQFPEHKDVAYYADKLNITPKYLSEITQSELGIPAKRFIDDFIAMEAKSLLKQTNMNIQEICYWLGFEDSSHFTKFFKKQTDKTPSEYRAT